MRPIDLQDLVGSMSHGDWVGIPDLDPDRVAGLIRSTPNIVIAPMHAMIGSNPDPVVSGVALGVFLSNQTSRRVITSLQRHGIGSRIFIPTKIPAEGIVYVEDYIIAVPSMRFSSHAVMAIRQ
jgi:hypothetical protein